MSNSTSNQYDTTSTSSSNSLLPPPELRSLPLPPFPSPSPTLTTNFLPMGTTAPLSIGLPPPSSSKTSATSSRIQPPARIRMTPSPSTSLENLVASEMDSHNNELTAMPRTSSTTTTSSSSPSKRSFPTHTTSDNVLPLPTSPSLAGKQAWTQPGARTGEESKGGKDAVGKEGGKGKSSNPLEDLIRTENLYVQDLGVIIKVRIELLLLRPSGLTHRRLSFFFWGVRLE